MEIIHIALGKVNPNRMNGVNKVVFNLATEQVKAGVNAQVWGISDSIEHNYPERNFNTVLFKKKRSPFAIPNGIEDALKASKSDTVFHLHGGFIPVFYSISKLMKKYGRKFVFTPHGSYNRIAWQKSGFSKRIYFQLFELPMLKNAAIVHVLGKSESEGLNFLHSGLPIQRAPYGFEIAQNNSVIYKSEEDYLIGFCGRIDIYTKGLDVLFESFAKFALQNSNAKLWIIGDGSERPKLEMFANRLGVSHKVVFHGSKFGEEKDKLIAQLNLFVHPSRNEGLPTAVLEALSMGISCLISEATNLGDEVRTSNSGIVIEKTTTDFMLQGFNDSFKKSMTTSVEELRTNAMKTVTEFFNWKKVIADFNNIYVAALIK
jgi:glycosyltransferase involved in cell wall biosynthesis